MCLSLKNSPILPRPARPIKLTHTCCISHLGFPQMNIVTVTYCSWQDEFRRSVSHPADSVSEFLSRTPLQGTKWGVLPRWFILSQNNLWCRMYSVFETACIWWTSGRYPAWVGPWEVNFPTETHIEYQSPMISNYFFRCRLWLGWCSRRSCRGHPAEVRG